MQKTNVPTLYPVACFITGTTPNGGGIWKYILHASPHGLLRRNLPVLTQVLHFLDFSVPPHMLESRWRKPLRESYNGNFQLSYSAPIFTDSGGFTLMFDPDLDLSEYNITRENLAEGILKLQIDLGASLVASLDYPIPPNLDETEIRRRMATTLDNALRSARYLAELPEEGRPSLYVPIHGPTPDVLSQFIRDLLGQFKAEGLDAILEGLALGSMVPLRKAHRTEEILAFARAARTTMPNNMPLHVFGVTGLLTPFLVAEGVTSFDTSAYVQEARNIRYLNPRTRQRCPVRDLVDYPCTCMVCRERNLPNDLALLDGQRKGQKSEVYAAIALHNLELDFQLLADANEAAAHDELSNFLEYMGSKYNGVSKLLNALKENTDKTAQHKHLSIRYHQPEDFDIRERLDYKPLKPICLILPCSQEKPYPSSQSYKFVWKKLQESVSSTLLKDIEVIFLSGLYGPVPAAYSEQEAVKTYDFLLNPHDQAGIERVTNRLADFLNSHGMNFRSIVAYVTLPVYRKVVELVARDCPNLTVLPQTKRLGQLAFYKLENINQLTQYLQPDLTQHKLPCED